MQTSTHPVARPSGSSRRVVGLAELRERFGITYARQHLHRREQQGTFPKAIKLGPGKFARRVWYEDDILAWLETIEAEASHG